MAKVTEQVCGWTPPLPPPPPHTHTGLFPEEDEGEGGTMGTGALFVGALCIMRGIHRRGHVAGGGIYHPEQMEK